MLDDFAASDCFQVGFRLGGEEEVCWPVDLHHDTLAGGSGLLGRVDENVECHWQVTRRVLGLNDLLVDAPLRQVVDHIAGLPIHVVRTILLVHQKFQILFIIAPVLFLLPFTELHLLEEAPPVYVIHLFGPPKVGGKLLVDPHLSTGHQSSGVAMEAGVEDLHLGKLLE